MAKLEVFTYVPAAVALAEGSTEFGTLTLPLTTEQIGMLDAREREALAEYCRSDSRCLHVKGMGWTGVRNAIRAEVDKAFIEEAKRADRIAQEVAHLNELIERLKQGRYFDPDSMPPEPLRGLDVPYSHTGCPELDRLWHEFDNRRAEGKARCIENADAKLQPDDMKRVGTVRYWGGRLSVPTPRADSIAHQAEQNAATEAAELAEAHRIMERAMLLGCGTADQVERYDAGVLPTSEFDTVAKRSLFGWINVPLYVPLKDSDVEHSEHCDDGEVKFATSHHDGALKKGQWETLKRIREAAPKDAEVEVREHRGYCNDCDHGVIHEIRLGVRVSIKWAGETYTREYGLPDV